MICPTCRSNHKKSEGLRCKCGYQFVFSPDRDKGMTDNKFMLILRKASADGRYYFTFPQLYYFCCTVKGKISFYGIVAKYIFFGFFAVVLLKVPLVLIAAVALMHSIHSIMYYCDRKEPINQEEFRKMVRKWSNIKGVPDKMLVKPSLHHPPPQFPEGDLYDYGVERIIIVERQLLVDLLVKNGFHTDQRALIFSADGYPSYIAERAKILLKASSDLPIYLLHDATEKGGAMKRKINYPKHKVIDLGIFPEQIKNLPVLKPLRLKSQEHQAALDVLPYAALSAIGGAAIAAGIPFDEVLASWRQEGNSVGDSSASNYG
ncbi:hypothetical protein H206_01469 [Candidatus Electrothrix aarhusensis]|uniref:Uncharacterized protein n=1 Tax=Candidatus Electrothrix aarhusensis TaxID=1859131 RepID=A0A3S3QQB5_9BACT|nr:hypothetical protein H206_01469 [Candidatus Electrothrix aarhusensis]